MSSLSATQADGYYIPPSYIESGAYKKQSINQYAKSKGHNQYDLSYGLNYPTMDFAPNVMDMSEKARDLTLIRKMVDFI